MQINAVANAVRAGNDAPEQMQNDGQVDRDGPVGKRQTKWKIGKRYSMTDSGIMGLREPRVGAGSMCRAKWKKWKNGIFGENRRGSTGRKAFADNGLQHAKFTNR